MAKRKVTNALVKYNRYLYDQGTLFMGFPDYKVVGEPIITHRVRDCCGVVLFPYSTEIHLVGISHDTFDSCHPDSFHLQNLLHLMSSTLGSDSFFAVPFGGSRKNYEYNLGILETNNIRVKGGYCDAYELREGHFDKSVLAIPNTKEVILCQQGGARRLRG